ncbi:hypothetical protein MJO28_015038 [Puccinia striiformis f. sp. tritici]|uniref:Uncharacterized protein n=1 Tax=Puccinia striiformis f. sp. tritici TaxID=168172 RepID=A0ACC0DRI2_9BASI|nr:hypothetical protein MJO28_015038 [Puccinia striiformis f. sp. tritici]
MEKTDETLQIVDIVLKMIESSLLFAASHRVPGHAIGMILCAWQGYGSDDRNGLFYFMFKDLIPDQP